jgi:2-iminobutanoate/2-iminopropanoate deaminase
MAKQPVAVPSLPQPIGPFSYATRSNGMLYVSGALGVDENWKVVAPNDVTAQSKKALETVKAILDAAKVPLADIVKVTVYLTNAADYKAFNEVRRAFFPPPYPASTVVVVKELVLKDAVVEIEVIAEAR